MAGGPELLTPENLLDRLRTEPQKRRRLEMLRRARPLWTPETVRRLYDEAARLTRIDLREAERIADAAYWVSLRTDDEAARATGWRAIGHIRYLKANYQAAIDCYRSALEIYDRLGMEVEAGRTMAGNGLQTLAYLGQYEEAFAWAERTREIFKRHGARRQLAILDHNIEHRLRRH